MELRRWLSHELSAGGSIDVGAEAPVRRVRQLTDGQGAGAVLDTTPYAAQAVAQAVHMVRDGGTVVASGLEGWRPFFELSSDDLVQQHRTMRRRWAARRELSHDRPR